MSESALELNWPADWDDDARHRFTMDCIHLGFLKGDEEDLDYKVRILAREMSRENTTLAKLAEYVAEMHDVAERYYHEVLAKESFDARVNKVMDAFVPTKGTNPLLAILMVALMALISLPAMVYIYLKRRAYDRRIKVYHNQIIPKFSQWLHRNDETRTALRIALSQIQTNHEKCACGEESEVYRRAVGVDTTKIGRPAIKPRDR